VVVLVVLAAIGTYVPLTLLAPVDAATASTISHTVASPTTAAITLPYGAESAASITGGADFEKLTGSKELLPTSGPNNPLPIASISKLITALVILDAKPLAAGQPGPSIVFSKDDSKLYDKYYVQNATIAPTYSGKRGQRRPWRPRTSDACDAISTRTWRARPPTSKTSTASVTSRAPSAGS